MLTWLFTWWFTFFFYLLFKVFFMFYKFYMLFLSYFTWLIWQRLFIMFQLLIWCFSVLLSVVMMVIRGEWVDFKFIESLPFCMVRYLPTSWFLKSKFSFSKREVLTFNSVSKVVFSKILQLEWLIFYYTPITVRSWSHTWKLWI